MTDSWLDSVDDRLEKIEAEQDSIQNSKTWEPEPGDVLKGTVVGGAIVPTKFGPAKIVNVLENGEEGGQVFTVWCSRKIIADRLTALAPKPGKGISVKYVGLKQPKRDGNAFHMYVMDAEESDFQYWDDVQQVFHNREEGSGAPSSSNVMDSSDDLSDPF